MRELLTQSALAGAMYHVVLTQSSGSMKTRAFQQVVIANLLQVCVSAAPGEGTNSTSTETKTPKNANPTKKQSVTSSAITKLFSSSS